MAVREDYNDVADQTREGLSADTLTGPKAVVFTITPGDSISSPSYLSTHHPESDHVIGNSTSLKTAHPKSRNILYLNNFYDQSGREKPNPTLRLNTLPQKTDKKLDLLAIPTNLYFHGERATQ
jgi:hypothetical protein